MRNRSRVRWSFAVALAAHALAIAWTLGRSRSSEEADGAHAQATEIDIAVEPLPAAEIPAPPNPAEVPPTEPAALKNTRREASRSAEARPATPAPPDGPAAQVVAVEPGGDGSWTFSPTAPSAETGKAGGGTDSASAMSKATAVGVAAVLAEAQRKADDRARKPLIFTARDMDLGLVPGGQYVSITRDRVRNSLVPLESHALLEFWTDSRGLVARVRVLGAPSDPRAWDDVASALTEDARTAFPLKIPSNADGFIVTLDVTSVMRTVSGAMASRNALVKALSAIQDPVDAVLDSKAVPQRVVAAKVVSVEAF